MPWKDRGVRIFLSVTIAGFLFFTLVLPLHSVLRSHLTPIRDPDSCYHFLRVLRGLETFPSIPVWDADLNYPYGHSIIWPPLYDFSLLLLARLIIGFAGIECLPVGLSCLPPFIGVFIFYISYRIGCAFLSSKRLACISAFFGLLLPASFTYTMFGMLDHHAAEVAALGLQILLLVSLFQRARKGKELLWCAALAVPVLVQQGAVIFGGLAVVSLLWIAGHEGKTWMQAALGLAGAALLLFPFSLIYHVEGKALFSHSQFGFFQPVFFGIGALIAAVPAVLFSKRPSWLRAVIIAVLMIVILALLIFISHDLLEGLRFAGRSSEWVSTIGESASPFFFPGKFNLGYALGELGFAGFLLPVLTGFLVYLNRKEPSPQKRLIVVYTVGLCILSFIQRRFLLHFSLVAGLPIAFLLGESNYFNPREGKNRSWLFFLVIPWVLIVLQSPALRTISFADVSYKDLERIQPLLTALKKERTRFVGPESARGVASRWDYGHWIELYGDHPVPADNFGYHAGDLEWVRSFFFEKDLERAYRTAKARKIRYVLAGDAFATAFNLSKTKSLEEFFLRERSVEGIRLLPTMEFKKTILYRLTEESADLEEGEHHPELGNFRLLKTSTPFERGGRLAAFRYLLFEIVESPPKK